MQYCTLCHQPLPENHFLLKTLTPREIEIVKLMGAGLCTKDIANKFNLAVKTVTKHKDNIYKKLGVHSQVAVAHYCLKNNLISFNETIDYDAGKTETVMVAAGD